MPPPTESIIFTTNDHTVLKEGRLHLQQQESIQIDELYFKSGLSSSAVATALLMLEMQNIIISLPGKVYKLT